MSETGKIQSYRDLRVWQKARELVLLTYKFSKKFPPDEQFALTSQVRRAAISITANLAEGYGRLSQKDREHFYVMAQGSLYELDSHFQIAADLNFISPVDYKKFIETQTDCLRMLRAFLKTHRSR